MKKKAAAAGPELRPAAMAAPQAGGWLRRHGPWLGLLLLTLAVYLPALHSGYVFDDDALTDNPLLTIPGGLSQIWLAPSLNAHEIHYWPLVYSTFWAEYRLWGLYPLGYHLDNILLHALCAVLLWRLLRRLKVPGAWLGAALFAVHPVHVESVAWVIERKDVLSGAFYLGAALAWLRFERTRHGVDYAWVALLFAGALLSKSIVVTLPVALGLLIWWRRGRLERRDWAPLAGLAALACAVTVADMLMFSRRNVSAAEVMSLPARIQMAGGALWLYLGKLAWPARLAMFYPQWRVDPAAPAAWLPLAAALGLAGVLWALRGRLGRGPLAAALFFGLTLSPALGLVWFNFLSLAWVADRFQYLASIGPLVLAAAALARLGGRAAALQKPLGAALLLALGILSWQQAGCYRNAETFFQHSVGVYPESSVAHYEYGRQLSNTNQFGAAIAEFNKALALKPAGQGVIYYELAMAQVKLKQLDEAGKNFQTALRLIPDNAKAYGNYGLFLSMQGHVDEALAQFQAGLKVQPDDPDLQSNLGTLYIARGRGSEGLELLQKAVRGNPGVAKYHAYLAWALTDLKRPGEAIAEYEAALKINPLDGTTQSNLGTMLLGLGQVARGIEHLEQAERLGLKNPILCYNLGEAYRLAGRTAEAIGQYDAALQLRPNYPEAAKRKEELRRGK